MLRHKTNNNKKEEGERGKERKRETKTTELELELIQFHMTQKPMLRGEVDARALRV